MTQDQIDGLISELEHEARQPINTPHMTDLMLKAGNALRESVRLRNAVSQATRDIIWMSGSNDFSPKGQAHEGWIKVRERLGNLTALCKELEM